MVWIYICSVLAVQGVRQRPVHVCVPLQRQHHLDSGGQTQVHPPASHQADLTADGQFNCSRHFVFLLILYIALKSVRSS